eukprot:gnl/MRDRNA2_/MRDRNA2_109904_c0_seq1.p1 gnl/MRDRNA2_/MRDRNA2_109904_c0~~gnl/MRDRNA2_/MRDRNA2_109904_c0_seq1.p1  ORF type:complete len:608 (-),score=101.55 gnl/MRDRNA2_/MRDRNA2_109904_c0_seq1:11-1834(-)
MPFSSRPSTGDRKKWIKGNYAKSRPVSAEPWRTSPWIAWGGGRENDKRQDWVFSSETLTLKPQWSDQHHVASSNQNAYLPHSQRMYFDELPKAKLQGRSKGRRLRPTDMESARCQAAAYSQAERWGWGKNDLVQAMRERKEHERAVVAAEIEEAALAAEAETVEDESTTRSAGVSSSFRHARRALTKKSPTRAGTLAFADGEGTQSKGTSDSRSFKKSATRGFGRSNTFASKTSSVEDRRVVLEKQVILMYEATNAIPTLEPFADFYKWCLKKFHNLTHCWRLLDTNLNMKLSYLEFLTSLRKYDFNGDARMIFRILDRDRTGCLTYYHFDPNGAVELAHVKGWCTKIFGGVTAAFEELDADKDGNISLEEFSQGSRKHGFENHDGAMPHIFEMLDLDKDRKVQPQEMKFLDNWDCPPWLMATPDFTGAQEFKRRLLTKYRGNAIVAWHFGLDRDNLMRVSWYDFAEAGKREHIMKDSLPGIWRALDTNLSGWLSLHEFDPDVWKLLVDFKKYCQRWGSIRQALPILDKNENGAISKREFLPVIKEMGLQEWEGDTLWTGLELNGDGTITRLKIAYLDKWSVDEEGREEEFWQVVADCLTTKHKSLT